MPTFEERTLMEPRKKESKKWTSLPPDFSAQIKSVFEDSFKIQLKGKSLRIDGRIYPSEIMLRVGLAEKGRLKHENFEVSLDHSPEKQDTIPKIHLAVDAIASMMMDYFEKSLSKTNVEDAEVDADADPENSEADDSEGYGSTFGSDLPYSWKKINFENEPIWFQFSTENSDLEAEANKLLGLDPEDDSLAAEDGGMIHGEDSDSADDTGLAEDDSLGAEDEDFAEDKDGDDVDTSSPKMFRGGGAKKKKEDMH